MSAFPPVHTVRRMPVSYSRGNCFEQCQAMFEAQYVAKIPQPRSVVLRVGVLLHDVLDQYIKHLVRTGQPSDYSAFESMFSEEWVRGHEGIPESMFPELQDIVIRTREMFVLPEIREVVGSEIEMSWDYSLNPIDWFNDQVFLRMKIDLLEIDPDWVATVTDYKSGFKIDDADSSSQLMLYAAVTFKKYPRVQKVKVRLVYGRLGIIKAHTFTKEEAVEGLRWIFAISDAIERNRASGDWPATPGTGCSYCPIFEGCPKRAEKAPTLPPNNAEEAEAILERLILVGEEKKNLQEMLSPWIAVQGPVVTGGMMLDLVPQNKREFPVSDLRRVAERSGIEIWGVVKGDTKALKKLGKKDPALQTALDEIAIDKSHSKLTLKKAGK